MPENEVKKRRYQNKNIHIKYSKSKTVKPLEAFSVSDVIVEAAILSDRKHNVSEAVKAEVRRLHGEGATPKQIADLLSVDYDKARRFVKIVTHVPKKKRAPRSCKVSREQVEDLRIKSEFSAVVIARKLKCSRSTVQRILATLARRKPTFRKKHEDLQKRERRGEFECVPITGRYYYAFPKGSSRMHTFPADSNFLYSICGLGVVDVDTRKTGRKPIPELLCVMCAKKEA